MIERYADTRQMRDDARVTVGALPRAMSDAYYAILSDDDDIAMIYALLREDDDDDDAYFSCYAQERAR